MTDVYQILVLHEKEKTGARLAVIGKSWVVGSLVDPGSRNPWSTLQPV